MPDDKLTCKVCGHSWKPKRKAGRELDKPLVCPHPRCHSAFWNDAPPAEKAKEER